MKFTVSTKTLRDALTSFKTIVKPNRTHAILGNVCFSADGKTLTIIGMDLDQRKKLAIPCRTLKKGSTTIKLGPLLDYLSKRPEPDCEFDLAITQNTETKADQHFTTIKCGRSKNVMPGLPANEMPPFPEVDSKNTVTIPAALLNECLAKCLVQSAIEDIRAHLKSVMLLSFEGMLKIQATNGQRAIIFYTPIPFVSDETYIVPRDSISAFSALGTIGDVVLKLGENIMSASVENCEFSTKLIEANVQKFESLFPPKEKLKINVTVHREEFLNEIECAETQTTDEYNSIKISCDGTTITIKSAGKDIGAVQNIMDAKDGSGVIEFSVNPIFLKDALKAFDEDEVTLRFMDAITPFIIRNESRISIVYPMRVQ